MEPLMQAKPADHASEPFPILLVVVMVGTPSEVPATAVLKGSLSSGDSQKRDMF